MINGVKHFLEIKENANCTFAIIKGISYIFKHDQQSHICGMVVSKAKLVFIYHFIFVEKTQQPVIYQFLQYFWKYGDTKRTPHILAWWELESDVLSQKGQFSWE